MRSCRLRAWVSFATVVALLAVGSNSARAQDFEPRSYSNAPAGMNFFVAGYAQTRGGLSFDPALPAQNEHLQTRSVVLAYARALDLGGLSGKFDVVVPLADLSGSVDFAGAPLTRNVSGLLDPRFRLSVNLLGAPALRLQDFATWRQDLIVGASVQVSAPWGQYDPTRVVNLGTNRWYVKPEIGASKALGPWNVELAVNATLFQDNDNFYGGTVRAQRPLYAAQGHAIYTFRSGLWISASATYYAGGRTTVDGVLDNDFQQNWRVGATVAYPIDARNSIKLNGSTGVHARTGNNFDLVALAWQHRWGGGL